MLFKVEKKPAVGTVNENNAVVRTGPKADDRAARFKLKVGQTVKVTGYTVDPTVSDTRFRLRYQFEWTDGQSYWTPGKYIDFEAVTDWRGLPFIGQTVERKVPAMLKAIGLEVADECTEDEIEPLFDLITYYNLPLQGIKSKAELTQAHEIITDLESYGVYLGSSRNGKWSLPDLQKVHEAVTLLAQGTARLVKTGYGIDDVRLSFRVLYAPLRIDRSPLNNVGPNPKEVWWARNDNGYEIILGNKVFFEGTVATNAKIAPGFTFSAVELIAHELGHVINFRYKLRTTRLISPWEFYVEAQTGTYTRANGEKVLFKSVNDGYTFVARSSNGKHETITDAITALSLDRFTKDAVGDARREQITDMMKQVLLYRVNEFGGLAAIRKATSPYVIKQIMPGVALIAKAPLALDEDLACLQAIKLA